MTNKTCISNENEPNFICRENGDIVIKRAETPKDRSNIQKEKNEDKSGEPYLFKKWHPSRQNGYVSDEFKSVKFSS